MGQTDGQHSGQECRPPRLLEATQFPLELSKSGRRRRPGFNSGKRAPYRGHQHPRVEEEKLTRELLWAYLHWPPRSGACGREKSSGGSLRSPGACNHHPRPKTDKGHFRHSTHSLSPLGEDSAPVLRDEPDSVPPTQTCSSGPTSGDLVLIHRPVSVGS